MNKEYKSLEQLKEELGDKFEKYMYNANIQLLERIDDVIRMLERIKENRKTPYTMEEKIILKILKGEDK